MISGGHLLQLGLIKRKSLPKGKEITHLKPKQMTRKLNLIAVLCLLIFGAHAQHPACDGVAKLDTIEVDSGDVVTGASRLLAYQYLEAVAARFPGDWGLDPCDGCTKQHETGCDMSVSFTKPSKVVMTKKIWKFLPGNQWRAKVDTSFTVSIVCSECIAIPLNQLLAGFSTYDFENMSPVVIPGMEYPALCNNVMQTANLQVPSITLANYVDDPAQTMQEAKDRYLAMLIYVNGAIFNDFGSWGCPIASCTDNSCAMNATIDGLPDPIYDPSVNGWAFPAIENLVLNYQCQACGEVGIEDVDDVGTPRLATNPNATAGDIDQITNIFPNPATDEVNINLQLIREQSITVELSDLTGRIILQRTYSNVQPGTTNLQLKLEGLSTGIYQLAVKGADQLIGTERLTIGK